MAVLAWIGSRLVVAAGHAVRGPARVRALEVCRGLRAHHFVLALPVLAAVVASASLLVLVPGLSFGWWTAIGGVGNPVTGTTSRAQGSPLEWLLPAVFLVLLVPALPLLVEREERMFRWGAEAWSWAKRAWRGVLFGLAHALIGIPIGVALALSVGGWYLTWAYLRGHRRAGPEFGLLESTRSHLAYNLVILTLVAVVTVAGAV